MEEAHEALNLQYDAYNDVLRVFTTPEPVPSIALPGEGATLLVSESLDRLVGMVFEHYRPTVFRGASPGLLHMKNEEEMLNFSFSIVENIVPSILAGCAPMAKDRVVQWLQAQPTED